MYPKPFSKFLNRAFLPFWKDWTSFMLSTMLIYERSNQEREVFNSLKSFWIRLTVQNLEPNHNLLMLISQLYFSMVHFSKLPFYIETLFKYGRKFTIYLGEWRCQVTSSSFNADDALSSRLARLVVRIPPSDPRIYFNGQFPNREVNHYLLLGQRTSL